MNAREIQKVVEEHDARLRSMQDQLTEIKTDTRWIKTYIPPLGVVVAFVAPLILRIMGG